MSIPYDKDPDATLDYGVSWADWLYSIDDAITDYSWNVPDGLVNEHESLLDGKTKKIVPGTLVENSVPTVWVSGGTPGTTYRLTNHIETSGGRVDERSIKIRVLQR